MANKKKKAAEKTDLPVEEVNEGQAVDITIDDAGVTQAPPAPESAKTVEIDMDALRTEVEKIVKERDEYLKMLTQVSADFDNYKKRNAQLRADARRDAQGEVAAAMLPVYDNLERAIEASQSGEGDALRKGVEMVSRQFLKVLEDLGVEEIDSRPGEPFDPTIHDAAVTVPADGDHKDNTVFDTLQKGYRMGEKVLRYATVRVAQDA